MKQIHDYIAAAKVFDEHVKQIKDDQWGLPTPDEGWTVRDLVNHVAAEDLWVKEMMDGKTVADVGDKLNGDILGENPKSAQAKASMVAAEAFSAPGGDEKTVMLSRGETPAVDYAEEMFADHLIHSWDLAVAIGADTKLPDDLVDAASQYFGKYAEMWRGAGAFKAAEKVGDDASAQDKLLALTGRDPGWKPSL